MFESMFYCVFSIFCGLLLACSNDSEPKKKTIPKVKIEAPKFNADSAYYFVEKQVSFGPRVISSKSWEKCAIWLEKKMRTSKRLSLPSIPHHH